MYLLRPEAATLPPDAIIKGLLPQSLLNPLSIAAAMLFAAVLWPALGPWGVVPAAVFARLMAFDLTTYTLPDIYIYPLIAAGLAHAAATGQWWHLVPAALFYGLYLVPQGAGKPYGIGGGDLKLLTALFLWFNPATACFAVALGCAVWLVPSMFMPRRPVPFGVPLLLGWLLFLAGLPSGLGLPI